MKRLFTLFALTCLVGVNLLAQEQEIENYDFRGFNASYDQNSFVWGEGNYVAGLAQGNNSVTFPAADRIEVDNRRSWQIGLDNDHNNVSFLQKNTATGTQASVYIHNLQIGDRVRIWFVDDNDGGIVQSNNTNLGPGSQISDGQIITIYTPGTLEFTLNRQYAGIRLIQITLSNLQPEEDGSYSYDPAIEIYDLYWVERGATYQREPAGFNLDFDNWEALLVTNLSDGTPLNRRLVISEVAYNGGYIPWSFINQNNGTSEGLRSDGNWHNFSVNNLVAGDRVRLIFHNNDFNDEGNEGYAKIASTQQTTNTIDATFSYSGCAAFQDTNNNGVQDEGEPSISAGLNLAGANNTNNDYVTYFYTVTEDGHLDFALYDNVRLCKIELYGDHQAAMVHKYNGSLTTGYTAYFNTTGQLEAKSHVIPGGLQIQVGNEDESQHALVVASPISPVAFATNERHRKFAINSENEFNTNNSLTSTLPTTGTFHKFTPEVSGNMTVRFYTSSINYLWPEQDGNFRDGSGTTNENPVNVSCPYYLIDVDANGNITKLREQTIATNTLVTWNVSNAQVGHTYYIYGGWSNGATANNYTVWTGAGSKHSLYGCGIAKLLDVTFIAEKIVYPLAKWVPNNTSAVKDGAGVPNADNPSQTDYYLATVKGYKYVKVKKMSDNITNCNPSLQLVSGTTYRLVIDGITYADANKGGVILIEVTDDLNSYNRADPVFALTVAYDASYHSTSTTPEPDRGHTWDFSTEPLNGLQWKNTYSNYAEVKPFGTYFQDFYGGSTIAPNTSSLLYDEMNWTDSHGIENSDWTFNYRLRAQGNNYDPQFLNNYDMEGDNADMMWDSEGMVILAGTNHSSIFNEFGQTVAHTETTDPDRYIGLWPGDTAHPSEFIIPWLDKDDRVIIWMGSGTGPESETTQMVFNITNARDAEYNEISATDNYIAGGSHWDGANDPYYRGCYHFFATGDGNGGPADMRFKLIGGTMCKIYKIQIYRGDRIITNDLVPVDGSPLYLLTEKGSEESIQGTYSIQYRGKGESISEPEMAGMTGNLTANDATLASLNDENTSVKFTTSTLKDKFGVFNMRLNDLERNNKYVADFADRNFPVDYYEKMPHPYTWDFTDVNRFNTTYLASENSKYSADDLNIWDAETNFTWKRDDELLFVPGGQIYADAQMMAEAAGIQFTPINMGNGTIKATNDGLRIEGGDLNENDVNALSIENITGGSYAIGSTEQKAIWEDPNGSSERTGWKLTIPNLPNLTAVYIRVQTIEGKDPKLTFNFSRGSGTVNDWNFFKKTIDNNNGTKDIIVGLSPSLGGDDMPYDIFLNNVIVKKIATSKDLKYIGKTGYATESRHRPIDHRLTEFFTNEPIKAYQAYFEGEGESTDYSKLVLEEVNVMPAAPNGGNYAEGKTGNEYPDETSDNQYGYGTILYHSTGTELSDGNTDKTANVIDGGFHLFVPDMHDLDTEQLNDEDYPGPDDISKNVMIAKLYNENIWNCVGKEKYFVGPYDGNKTNLILSAKKYAYGTNGANVSDTGYEVFFVRVDPNGNGGKGATLSGHSAYLQIPTDKMKKLSTISVTNAKMNSFFGDDPFGEVYEGIATGISEVTEQGSKKVEWYTIDGRKLNSMPTQQGLYIVNGRKVMIK